MSRNRENSRNPLDTFRYGNSVFCILPFLPTFQQKEIKGKRNVEFFLRKNWRKIYFKKTNLKIDFFCEIWKVFWNKKTTKSVVVRLMCVTERPFGCLDMIAGSESRLNIMGWKLSDIGWRRPSRTRSGHEGLREGIAKFFYSFISHIGHNIWWENSWNRSFGPKKHPKMQIILCPMGLMKE